MSVYVDDVRRRFGRMIMCHMWADSLDELHAMATKLGLRRSWFQQPPKASWEHYDVSLTVKARAIAAGAVLTDKYGPVIHTSRLRLSHPDETVRARAQKMLDTVVACRALPKMTDAPLRLRHARAGDRRPRSARHARGRRP